MLDRIAQLGCSTFRRNHPDCRRAICRRYRYCVPPRYEEYPAVFRCPFEAEDAWFNRVAAVSKIGERLIKVGEASHVARGLPSPFAPKPVPDYLDLTKPLDFAALLASRQGEDDATEGRK